MPFYVRTGKRLARELTEIRMHFKRTPQALFAHTPEEPTDPNIISLRIQPDEGISLQFGAKRPGSQIQLAPVQADFSYREAFGAKIPVAYQTLLLDACAAIPRCSHAATKSKPNGALSRPLKTHG